MGRDQFCPQVLTLVAIASSANRAGGFDLGWNTCGISNRDGWFVVKQAVDKRKLRKDHAMSLQGALLYIVIILTLDTCSKFMEWETSNRLLSVFFNLFNPLRQYWDKTVGLRVQCCVLCFVKQPWYEPNALISTNYFDMNYLEINQHSCYEQTLLIIWTNHRSSCGGKRDRERPDALPVPLPFPFSCKWLEPFLLIISLIQFGQQRLWHCFGFLMDRETWWRLGNLMWEAQSSELRAGLKQSGRRWARWNI